MHKLRDSKEFRQPPTKRPERPESDSWSIFQGLRREDVETIRSAAVKRTFGASTIILSADEPALHFLLLENGFVDYFVKTLEGREIMLRRLVRGDPLGLAAILSDATGYLGTAKSVHEVKALVWERQIIQQLGTTYPQLRENALRIGLRYFALYAKRHVRLVSNSDQERVAYALAELASRTGHAHGSGLEVEVKNEKLASLADVSSQSVRRFLQLWNREGALEETRGKLVVQRPERLLAA